MPQATPARILVIDDDPIVADSLAEYLQTQGYDTSTALDGAEGLAALAEAETPAQRPFDLVICDVSLPAMNGLDVLRKVMQDHTGTAVVMLTGYGSVETAVKALKLGAADYLTKPVVDEELRLALERAIAQQRLLAENRVLRRRLDHRAGLDGIVGSDHRMARMFELIEAVAPSRTTVLMTGESGTGKSLVAHAIHYRSPRRDKPFVEISCGSIPETLLESELFGHVRGAFTGAHADKAGRFLAANTGTIFLDEINSASPGMQLKLLRVLQERKFEPVGSTQTVEVDVRVVLASNQPLEQLVAEGLFRQDLYYRINVVKIELPPLRDRVGDIPGLADHFLRLHAAELGKQIAGFTPDALDALRRYPYPGNVRELANIVERAAVLSRRPTITLEDLPAHVVEGKAGLVLQGPSQTPSEDEPWVPMRLDDALRVPERTILLRALKHNGWNRQKTADQLGINRTTLYKKMKTCGIDGRLAG
jgi:DNA-binding NtrC family response regulator